MIDLGLGGRRLLRVDPLVEGMLLVFDGDAHLSIESPAEAADGTGPVGRERFAVGDTVASAMADDRSGALDLALTSGVHVLVGPDPDYEAWHLMEPHTFTGCMPGGGLM